MHFWIIRPAERESDAVTGGEWICTFRENEQIPWQLRCTSMYFLFFQNKPASELKIDTTGIKAHCWQISMFRRTVACWKSWRGKNRDEHLSTKGERRYIDSVDFPRLSQPWELKLYLHKNLSRVEFGSYYYVCLCFNLKKNFKKVFNFRALYKILVFSDRVRSLASLLFSDVTFISDIIACQSFPFMSPHRQERKKLHKMESLGHWAR